MSVYAVHQGRLEQAAVIDGRIQFNGWSTKHPSPEWHDTPAAAWCAWRDHCRARWEQDAESAQAWKVAMAEAEYELAACEETER